MIFVVTIALLFCILPAHITDGGMVYKTDVLILGAGMTGVAAGQRLTDLDVKNFIILEGTNRVGGRVHDVQFGGKTVELGANWIHGTEGNPLFHLAQKYGLKMVKGYDYDELIVRSRNGSDVTELAKKYMDKLDQAIDQSEAIRTRKLNKSEPDITYRSALRMSGWLPKNSIMDVVEYKSFDIYYATSPDQISLKNGGFYNNYVNFKYEDAFVVDQRGYKYVIERMLKEYTTEGDKRVHLGKIVEDIAYKNRSGVAVTTKDGDVYKAKFVICTFSAGVLQNKVAKFKPEMPSWKIDVINNFQMNHYLKIFVKFPEGTKRFWDEETQLFYAHHRRGYYPMIQNLEAKRLFPSGTNILLVTVTDAEAVRVSRIPKAEAIAELNEVFKGLYGSQAVAIEDILVPDWTTNPLYFGTYSNWPLGVTTEHFSILRMPLGGLFFAGEYTSRDYYGFVHGAMYEGYSAANAIVRCLKRSVCPKTYYQPNIAPKRYKTCGK